MNNIKVKYDKLKPNLLWNPTQIEALFPYSATAGTTPGCISAASSISCLSERYWYFLSAWYRHLHKQTQCHYGESSCMPLKGTTHHLSV